MPNPRRTVIVRFRRDRQRWEVDHPNPGGVRPRRARPTFPTEEAAHAYATDILKRLNDALPVVADRDIVLRAYVPKFLAARAPDVAARTLTSYCGSLERYVLPRLGHRKVREIRRRELKELVGELRQQGLAPDTVRLAKAAMSALLTNAVDDEIIDTNPAFRVGRVRGPQASDGPVEKIRPLSRVQRDDFLQAAARHQPEAVAFEVMAKAGLRPSEAYALQPADVDLQARTLRVERALDLRRRIKTTKTRVGRTVHLSRGLAAVLRRHLVRLETKKLARGWDEVLWLFPTDANTPLDPSNVRRVFVRALRASKLAGHRTYDLRHTYATLLLANGAPIAYVSHQLGHQSPATTLRHYVRWIPSDNGRLDDLLDTVDLLDRRSDAASDRRNSASSVT